MINASMSFFNNFLNDIQYFSKGELNLTFLSSTNAEKKDCRREMEGIVKKLVEISEMNKSTEPDIDRGLFDMIL